MTKLVLPEGYLPVPWTATKTPEGYELFDSHSRSFGFIKNPNNNTLDLVLLAPAMAEEIKRLREEAIALEKTIEFFRRGIDEADQNIRDKEQVIEAGARQNAKLASELEALRRSPATREDRAFQCLQGLLANANVIGYNGQVGWGLFNCDEKQLGAFCGKLADNVLAALAKPAKTEGGV